MPGIEFRWWYRLRASWVEMIVFPGDDLETWWGFLQSLLVKPTHSSIWQKDACLLHFAADWAGCLSDFLRGREYPLFQEQVMWPADWGLNFIYLQSLWDLTGLRHQFEEIGQCPLGPMVLSTHAKAFEESCLGLHHSIQKSVTQERDSLTG